MKVKFDKVPEIAEMASGQKINYGPAKRPFAKLRFRIVLTIFLAPFVFYAFYVSYNYIMTTELGLIKIDEQQIESEVEGRVVEIVRESSIVKAGDTVVKIVNKQLANQYSYYSNSIDRLETRISHLSFKQVEKIAIAKELYEYRYNIYHKILQLRAKYAATQYEVLEKLAKLKEARDDWEHEKEAKNSTEILSLREDVELKKEALQKLDHQILQQDIKSPANGTITKEHVKIGQLVNPHQKVATVQLDNKLRIFTYLKPDNAKYAELGQRVTIVFPNNILRISGTVSDIKTETISIPNGLKSIFAKNSLAIILEIKPETRIPKRFRINNLPLSIRFELFSFI